MGIDNGADGNIVIDRRDKVGDIFGYIHLKEPFSLLEGVRSVGEVAAQHTVNDSVMIGLIEVIQPISEDRIGSVAENAGGLLLFQLIGDIQHRFAGGNDIVGDKDILTLNGSAKILMSDNWVPAIDDPGLIPSCIEHTQIDSQNGGIIHISVHGAFIRAYHHEVLTVEL